ncbi:hypothetical protein BJP25_22690 [Actinokineospora bangkokensis]|uniref:Anti-sigma factor antagonist n=1 Tax=Actinokineospora bangkokensis TaxID=1193682 RepID=A0A1Q9LJY2_9PSEU|nr:hypothetical protein BJP25_22690 [Actinokineospora bangkokensis]
MTIDHDQRTGGHHLVVTGDLDYTNATELEQVLTDLHLDAGDTLTLDLGHLEFCDSTGLSTLIAAHRKVDRAGARIALTAVEPNLARVMEITGISHLFGPQTTSATSPADEGTTGT